MIEIPVILVLTSYSCLIGTSLYLTRNVNIPHNRNPEIDRLFY